MYVVMANNGQNDVLASWKDQKTVQRFIRHCKKPADELTFKKFIEQYRTDIRDACAKKYGASKLVAAIRKRDAMLPAPPAPLFHLPEFIKEHLMDIRNQIKYAH